MILFPPAKVNLGLRILSKRPDGFHEIETVMAEIPFCDILELTEAPQDSFEQTGLTFAPDGKLNLCEQAVALLRKHSNFPGVHIHLRKQIPVGAGLGGGSADASYTLIGLNRLFNLGFSDLQLEGFAAQLGSDCAFFIRGGLQLATGRGECLSPIADQGFQKWLVLCNPGIHVSTAAAYAKVQPKNSGPTLLEIMQNEGISGLKNDFELSVFQQFPAIQALKNDLEQAGAYYTAMSGSGSSVFALYDHEPNLGEDLSQLIVFKGLWKF
ncbi:MAG: 4-(cytidine 5'-diphospho)-2-C-methyl-D-erythritol kinase [Flavobacteriales bacterium]